MRTIREVLRLHHEMHLTLAQIARSCRIGKTTVFRCLQRAEAAGVGWPLPEGLDDRELERRLYPTSGQRSAERGEPDWAVVDAELGRKGVTRRQLWLEYREAHPQGFDYSWFCQHLAAYRVRREPSMRQHHTPGEVLFVDYAGQTVAITDPGDGGVDAAAVFVAILGASQAIYTELTASQSSADWLASHRRALTYYGGVPRVVVPDNLKAAVTRAQRYDPQLNIAYADLAQHYGFAVVPARVGKPQDKALVENAVLIVEREVLAPLRGRTFFSLAEANAAVRQRLEAVNQRPFTRQPGSRAERLAELERPALRPLPEQAFEPAKWRRCKLAADYHLVHAGHAYSLPHGLIGEAVELRITAATVEAFHQGQRIAAHVRRDGPGQTTLTEHMPPAHQAYAALNAEGLLRWALCCGEATTRLLRTQLENRPLRVARRFGEGLQRLARVYGPQRLEAAAQYALRVGVDSYTSLASILQRGLDQQAPPSPASETAPIHHANVRGAGYYH
ncbi:IS21 family transposase [Arhodomonas sp. SL1]|uniref:IS21 family transposase n=1 Tax=Arhodomonas sp. SL1 TaxID=3425691 RepID=UPI003F885D7B